MFGLEVLVLLSECGVLDLLELGEELLDLGKLL